MSLVGHLFQGIRNGANNRVAPYLLLYEVSQSTEYEPTRDPEAVDANTNQSGVVTADSLKHIAVNALQAP